MKQLKCRMEVLDNLLLLSDDEIARFVRGAVRYAKNGTVPELIGREAEVWGTAKQAIDRQRSEYEKRVGIASGARSKKSINNIINNPINNIINNVIDNPIDNVINNPIDNPIDRDKRFRPPTLEEVMEYVDANCLGFSAQKFYDYYQGNGWMVGNNKMANWQAIARRWGDRERDRAREEYNRKSPAQRLIARIEAGEFDE